MKNSTHEYFSSVSSAVEMLRHLFPVQAMVHVGAGDGHAAVQEWQGWNIPHVVLIEADPEYKESLQETTGQHDGWLAVSALIGEQETETEFYEASNPWESGTIPPEKWQGIWPNLTQTASIPLQQLRLESLLKESPCDLFAQKVNWANIDCMPALPIIKGAGESVGQWDIIKARVILDPSFIDNMDAGLDEISNYLAQYDFRCVAVMDSHHPAVGEALFVRNWKNVLQNDIAELQKEQAAQNVRVQSQLDQLSKALDKQTRRAEERQNHLDRAVQDLAGRDRQLAERDRQLGEAQTQLEAQKKSMAGCEKLINELNEQARQNEKTLAEQTRLAE
ncbi:MAG TPA: hypothetical protein ENI88_05830, partial [Desulfobulbus sp.]|nr:hypothetical protein [Desulfobulbus sp.]